MWQGVERHLRGRAGSDAVGEWVQCCGRRGRARGSPDVDAAYVELIFVFHDLSEGGALVTAAVYRDTRISSGLCRAWGVRCVWLV